MTAKYPPELAKHVTTLKKAMDYRREHFSSGLSSDHFDTNVIMQQRILGLQESETQKEAQPPRNMSDE